MLFSGIFAGARNDLQMWIETARGEHNVQICGVCGGGSNQPAGAFDLRLSQNWLLGRVTSKREPVLGRKLLPFGLSVFDENESDRLARQFPGHAPAHPPHPAD